MKRNISVFLFTVVFLLLLGVPGFGHHGVSNFDVQHEATVQGKVTLYEFVNPHVEIRMEVKNASGAVEEWVMEGSSPNMMRRVGWSSKTMKVGDVISVIGNPGKNGKTIMRLAKVILTDGQQLQAWKN